MKKRPKILDVVTSWSRITWCKWIHIDIRLIAGSPEPGPTRSIQRRPLSAARTPRGAATITDRQPPAVKETGLGRVDGESVLSVWRPKSPRLERGK